MFLRQIFEYNFFITSIAVNDACSMYGLILLSLV